MCGDYKDAKKEKAQSREEIIAELSSYYTNYDFTLFSEMFVYYNVRYKIRISDILLFIISSFNNISIPNESISTLNEILEKQKLIELQGISYQEIKKVHLPEREKVLNIIKGR